MIEKGTICYISEYRSTGWSIKPVIVSSNLTVDEWGNKGYIADFLVVKEHRFVRGIPIQEFESTDWQKIPKEYRKYDVQKLCMELERVVWRLTKKERELMNTLRYNCPDELKIAYQEGLLVKKENITNWRIEVELNRNNEYRVIKKIPAWTLSYGEDHRTFVFLSESKLYSTYEEAQEVIRLEKEKWNKEASLTDEEWSVKEIDKVLKYFPETERAAYREKLLSMDELWDLEVKKLGKKLLYRYFTAKTEWRELVV